jgi:UDP-N-acetylglucosamine 2-epimerase (non-hydrolysing)
LTSPMDPAAARETDLNPASTLSRKALVVFGTRPEAIKLAPVIRALQSATDSFETRVCVTGQHREMLDQVLDVFRIQPDWDLNLMTRDQGLTALTSRVLQGLEQILVEWRPDILLVQGDTTTTFAAALAAFYQQIPVGHVEAGIRTYDRFAPWPEEINRRLATVLATTHFAPTERARRQLLAEGIREDSITVTGNTVIDALFETRQLIRDDPEMQSAINRRFRFLDTQKKLIVVTGHRRENFGEGFQSFCRALRRLAARPDCQIVYPVHLNPNVLRPVREILDDQEDVFLIEPLAYPSFVALLDRSYLIITDSGGIQEEAPSLGKPVLVTRPTTERQEAVEAGTVKLVGVDENTIVYEANRLLTNRDAYEVMARAKNPYGDGNAAKLILKELLGG